MSNSGSYTVLHRSLDCLHKICVSAAAERGNRGKGGQKVKQKAGQVPAGTLANESFHLQPARVFDP